mmetsp:Transcript_34540/g.75390  ORF Transcript_34540/g.75390 Transcript_34540/m.75390 type:complete len:298 (-) Transcript_34540:48-941(-)
MLRGDDAGARLLASAFGACIAEPLTLPIDVVKTRLQVQVVRGVTEPGRRRYLGMADCMMYTGRHEGVSALWKGLTPALLRQVSYTSLGFVLYEPVRDVFGVFGQPGAPPNYLQRLLAGGVAGGISIAVFNPLDVVKTKLQASSMGHSVSEVARNIWADRGVAGFWAGVQPNIARTFLVCAAELGTYDEAKTRIIAHRGDGVLTHTAASGIAGFASACTSTPADVVKTRLMNGAVRGEAAYDGVFHAFSSILRQEGFFAFYKGFVPIMCRKVTWSTIFFVVYEQSRALLNSSGALRTK